MYDFEDLEDYVLGRMSEADRAAFESELLSDPVLQRRVKALRAEQDILRTLRRQAMREKFGKWKAETMRENAPPAAKNIRDRLKRILLIVFCLSLLAVGYRYLFVQEALIQAPPVSAPAPSGALPADDSAGQDIPPRSVLPQAALRPFPWKKSASSIHLTLFKKEALMGGEERNILDSVLLLMQENKLYQALQLAGTADTTKSDIQLCLAHLLWTSGNYARAAHWYGAVKRNPDSVRFQLDASINEIACYVYLMPASRHKLFPLIQSMMEHPDDYALSPERRMALEKVWEEMNRR